MPFTETTRHHPVCTGGIIIVDPLANQGVRIMCPAETPPFGLIWTMGSLLGEPFATLAGRPTCCTEASRLDRIGTSVVFTSTTVNASLCLVVVYMIISPTLYTCVDYLVVNVCI